MASNEQCGGTAGIQLYCSYLNNQLVIMTRWYSSHPQWKLQSRRSYQASECGQLADNQTSQLPWATHNAARDAPKLQSVQAKTQAIENRRYRTCVESEIRAELGIAQSVCFSVNF